MGIDQSHPNLGRCRQKESLTIIDNQCERLEELVSNLIDVSHPEADLFAINKRRLSMASPIHKAVELPDS
jgi:signal transduction histidine kinase